MAIQIKEFSKASDIGFWNLALWDFRASNHAPAALKGKFAFLIDLGLKGDVSDMRLKKERDMINNIVERESTLFNDVVYSGTRYPVRNVIVAASINLMEDIASKTQFMSHLRNYAGHNGFDRLTLAVVPTGLLDIIKEAPVFSGDGGGDLSDFERDFDQISLDVFLQDGSDIHLEIRKSPERSRIRIRQDGFLRHYRDISEAWGMSFSRTIYNSLSESGSRKDSFNQRMRQNSVITRTYPEVGSLRFRYASMPIVPDGFDVTLRILPIGVVDEKILSSQDLGYTASQDKLIHRSFSRATGMTLVAGITGSGKSTSLKNFIEGIARDKPGLKIRTIEEPVEYRIRGADQTPVTVNERDPEGSNPLLLTLRAALRSDPDFIMVGEIRDLDTAMLAIQSVQTGHQVASTIHTNSATGIIDRLTTMGVSRDILAQHDIFSGLIYQKLMPTLCPHCKIPIKEKIAENPDEIEKSGLLDRLTQIGCTPQKSKLYFHRNNGCNHCSHRGYQKRKVCAEIIIPTHAMSNCIADNKSIYRLWRDQSKGQLIEETSMGYTAFEHAILGMKLGEFSPRDVESFFKDLDEVLTLDD